MDSQSVFDHEGPWSEAAYLALKHDGRVEVVDGTLLVGPNARPRRTRAIGRVREAVAAALPDGLIVRGPLPLRLGPDCVLVPDLIITAAPAHEGEPGDESADAQPAAEVEAPVIVDAAAALMVIEVVGSDHGAADRSFKLQLYARSRIPYSVLLDHDGPFAVADMIIGGRYHEYARAGGEEKLLIEEPFRLELDLAEITAPEPARPAEPRDSATEAPPTQALPVVPTEDPGGPARPINA
ncbi:putative restriction endonuclease [Pseudonocardia hierapolitana]|uniref:Putative restriction endonuclease n=1 Tax=Pseudonocardia hierapolitana TaxID=1128676 RepID=A0A561SXY4_9PSEU|nr:Uma2 family endonuclease [Pseudonocardia hierapolitana]TWF79728.1 putative restriction endonuclease [Pseudonocardia hierapolitana]